MSLRFVRSTNEDLATLHAWINADPWHSYKDAAEWWISGGYLAFKLVDKDGDVLFVRLDHEDCSGTLVRLHTQFAPDDVVSKRRVAKALSFGVTEFAPHGVANGLTGFVTESVSPDLIAFMVHHIGFKPNTGNDFVLNFSDLKKSEGQ